MRSLYLPLIIFWNAATGQLPARLAASFDTLICLSAELRGRLGDVGFMVSFLSILASLLLLRQIKT
jgi:hypothetical protein